MLPEQRSKFFQLLFFERNGGAGAKNIALAVAERGAISHFSERYPTLRAGRASESVGRFVERREGEKEKEREEKEDVL